MAGNIYVVSLGLAIQQLRYLQKASGCAYMEAERQRGQQQCPIQNSLSSWIWVSSPSPNAPRRSLIPHEPKL